MIQSIEEGRKEDGNRAIAKKIIGRLHDLEKTVENNQGRWAWELLQNAKDSIADDENRKVSVQIELFTDKVEFRHNGLHFTEQDVRGIINQITSKEIEEGQHSKRTGRFGTGFLTTHLLSKVIGVKGIVETANKDFFKFNFPLDRDAKTDAQLIPKVENAWEKFHSSASKINTNYNINEFNTSFSYYLKTTKQMEIARVGIDEFIKLIPFVLAFVPKIYKVDVIDNILEKTVCFENNRAIVEDFIISVSKRTNGEETKIFLLLASNDKISIASEIEQNEKGYSVKSTKEIPKFFCDFPLIGTENFFFPVVINSFFLNPQTERDGVWLKGIGDTEVEENKSILENAIELYKNLLSKITEKNFFNLYNLAETNISFTQQKFLDEVWYKNKIQAPLREIILNSKLVEIENEPLIKKSISELWFPDTSYNSQVQNQIWKFTFDLRPEKVCKGIHISYWSEISWSGWNKITFEVLTATVSKFEKIDSLGNTLRKNEIETYEWLNSFCTFLLKDDRNVILLENYSIIPNQKGNFKKKSELFIDEIKDEVLIQILQLLGYDLRDRLLSSKIYFGNYIQFTKKEIAVSITDRLTEKLKGSINQNEELIKAISLLSEWFENNQELGKELFPEIYRKKAELFMKTIVDKDSLYKLMRSNADLAQLSKIAQTMKDSPHIMDNIQKIEEFSNLLKEFKANDITELKKMLLLAQSVTASNLKTDISLDILVNLGVTSIDELEEALKDKDLALMFNHTSTPNVEMFLHVQKLIKRSKENVIEYLKTRPNYDCSDIEELANTVFGGIKKDGLLIHVVVRPSDYGEVIVYFSSEKDTLDYENAELWIDNGRDIPRHLTLGKILKTTGIKKIPI